MKKTSLLLSVLVILAACNQKKEKSVAPDLKEQTVSYTVDSLHFTSYVVYNQNDSAKRPGIIVVHEWWGLNDYTKRRARELASLGYVAMAIDMYGNGRMGNDPDQAGKLATPYYQNPQMAKKIFDAGLNELKKIS